MGSDSGERPEGFPHYWEGGKYLHDEREDPALSPFLPSQAAAIKKLLDDLARRAKKQPRSGAAEDAFERIRIAADRARTKLTYLDGQKPIRLRFQDRLTRIARAPRPGAKLQREEEETREAIAFAAFELGFHVGDLDDDDGDDVYLEMLSADEVAQAAARAKKVFRTEKEAGGPVLDYVVEIACALFDMTGRKIGFSRPPDGGSPYGPQFRLVSIALEPVTFVTVSKVENLIRQARKIQ